MSIGDGKDVAHGDGSIDPKLFSQLRFGLFVHWGLYAIPAWHEQHQLRLGVPRAEYSKLIDQFNPSRFDPDAWLDLAEQAGLEYRQIRVDQEPEGVNLFLRVRR